MANNFNSKGFNLIGDGTDAVGFARTDIVGTRSNPIDPQLGTLQNNGGPTLTQAPLSGSIVIDAGNLSISGSGFDQRGNGFNRIVDGSGGGRVQIDIGAVEFSGNDVTPPPTDGFQVLEGDERRNRLLGAGGRDRINGFAGPDRLKGRGGNDILTGGDGKDTLLGDSGDDILSGGLGKDRLKGGGGKDTFLYGGLEEGKDVILDFKVGQDLIDLSTIFDSAPYNSATPFEDYVRLGKIGRNTLVEVLDVNASTNEQPVFAALATVRNVASSALDTNSFVL